MNNDLNMMNNLYYCYNPVKKDFILTMGLHYIDKGTHLKTNRNYWTFKRGTELDAILNKWRKFQELRFNN